MSALTSTSQGPRSLATRAGAPLVALGALVAIGISILILSLAGHHRQPHSTAGARAHPTTAPAPLVGHAGGPPVLPPPNASARIGPGSGAIEPGDRGAFAGP